MIPYVIDKSTNNERVFDIYSKLLFDRIIFIEGEITNEKANIIISELIYLDSLNHNDIKLYINSPGGSITAGMGIYDTMQFVKSNVITIGIGICASMAAILLSSGYKRYSLLNTEIMIHQPIGGVEGQATEITITANRINLLKDKLYKILSKNTKQKLSKIITDCERDYYLEASEAKVYGIIDEII